MVENSNAVNKEGVNSSTFNNNKANNLNFGIFAITPQPPSSNTTNNGSNASKKRVNPSPINEKPQKKPRLNLYANNSDSMSTNGYNQVMITEKDVATHEAVMAETYDA